MFLYDMNNPIEREMYLSRKKSSIQRAAGKVDLQSGFVEVMKEQQQEWEYFRAKQQYEQELIERITKLVEEKAAAAVEDTISILLK